MTFYFRLSKSKPLEPPAPTFIKRVYSSTRDIRGLFKCNNGKCSNTFITITYRVRKGLTKSCGCYAKQVTRARSVKHTHHSDYKCTRTYKTWEGMINRCSNPRDKDYKNYGDRGITVCEDWHDFTSFLYDMGERPKGKTIDRINNNKGYYKANCRWATKTQQDRNKRNTLLVNYNGELRPLVEVYEDLKVSIPYTRLRGRIRIGWTLEQAIAE